MRKICKNVCHTGRGLSSSVILQTYIEFNQCNIILLNFIQVTISLIYWDILNVLGVCRMKIKSVCNYLVPPGQLFFYFFFYCCVTGFVFYWRVILASALIPFLLLTDAYLSSLGLQTHKIPCHFWFFLKAKENSDHT